MIDDAIAHTYQAPTEEEVKKQEQKLEQYTTGLNNAITKTIDDIMGGK
jgi:hypothetical protein